MTTSGEKISHLIGGTTYLLPDKLPALSEVVSVKSVDVANSIVTFETRRIPIPDPVRGVALDPLKSELSITMDSGVSFTADLSPVNTDTKLVSVADVGRGTHNIAYVLSDGTTVVYSPSNANNIDSKVDKTTQILSTDTGLIVTNGSLADDVTLSLLTNAANGVVKLNTNALIPDALYAPNIMKFPVASYDPTSGAAPVGVEGELLFVKNTGHMTVAPFGTTIANTNFKVLAGDILRYVGGSWHLISRSTIDTVKATQISVTTFDGFTGNLQQILPDLYDALVPKTTKIKSSDIRELTINGKVEDDLSTQINLDIVTNQADALLGLDASGLIPIAHMPISSFEFHGALDATKAIPAFRPKANPTDPDIPWYSGDTLQVTIGSYPADAAFQFVDVGETALGNGPLAEGDVIVRDSNGEWIKSASGSALKADLVLTALSTAGLTNLYVTGAPPQKLPNVFQAINNSAAFKPANNVFTGTNEFQGDTVLTKVTFGTTATNTVLPLVRGVDKQVLTTDGNGTAYWGWIAPTEVKGSITGIAGTNLPEFLNTIWGGCIRKTPDTGGQTLQGTLTGDHTELEAHTGVITGDGSTENQIANLVLNSGKMNNTPPLAGRNRIQISTSVTPSEVPAASTLLEGELSVNIADRRVFIGTSGGTAVELQYMQQPAFTNAGDVLQINTGVDGIEWATPPNPAILQGGELDITLDPSLLPLTNELLYTVKSAGVAHTGFKGIEGTALPKGAVLLHSMNGYWARLDHLGTNNANVRTGTVAPTSPPPKQGDLWFKTDANRMFIYLDNAGAPTWVDTSPAMIAFRDLKGTGNRAVYATNDGVLKHDTSTMTTVDKLALLGITTAELKTLLGLP